MSAPESKVSCKYGAPMGRGTGPEYLEGVVAVRRVRLDRGGYDKGGAYWGTGEPLWYASGSDDGESYRRAPNRDAAKLLFSDMLSEGSRFAR